MNFTPMSDEEIQSANLIPDGQYQAEVLDAQDKNEHGQPLLTQKGVEKINLQLKVYDQQGKAHTLQCVLTPAYMKLLKRFADAAGLSDQYKKGNINADTCLAVTRLIGVEITMRSYINKQNQEIFVNNVNDFMSLDASTTAPVQQELDKLFDDTIPF